MSWPTVSRSGVGDSPADMGTPRRARSVRVIVGRSVAGRAGPARGCAGRRLGARWVHRCTCPDRPWPGPGSQEAEMATARDIMTGGAECVGENETLVEAARKMRDLDVGSLPICGEDNRLKGMVTDRDIVVKCLAQGGDPNDVTAAGLAQGKPVTIGADDSAEETLRTMAKYQVRRLPVIDGHKLVGIVAQADVARALPNEVVGQVLEEVSEK